MSDTNKLKSFFKGSAILILSNICLKAINFFLLPLYTDHLTPHMLGVSDTVTSFTGLLFPILVMGLDSAYSAFYFDKDDHKRSQKVYNSIIFMMVLIGLIPVVGCAFAGPLASLIFGTVEAKTVIWVALLSVTFNLWYLPFSLEIRLQNRMTIFGILTVLASLSMIGLNILFVSILKMGEMSLILSSTIVNLLQLLLFGLCAKTKINFKEIDFHLIKNMLRFAIPLIPTVIAMWLLNLSDRYVLLYFHGETAVGIYGIGSRFVVLMNVVISAVSMAYTTFAYSNIDNPEAKNQYRVVLNLMYVALIGMGFTLALFSKELISIMTSTAYVTAYKPMRDMMFSQIIYGVSTITGYGIFFAKKSQYSLYSTIAGATVNLVLNIVFIPKYGIVAAAATTLVGYIVMFVINYYFSKKLYPCDYGMKLISINMVVLYGVSFFCEEMSFYIKLGIWAVAAVGTLVMFRNRLFDFLKIIKKS